MGIEHVLFSRRSEQIHLWLQQLLQKEIPPEGDLLSILRDGILLCEAINAIWPDTITEVLYTRTSSSSVENVNSFLEACKLLGVPNDCIFEPDDVLTNKSPMKVLQTIFYLAAMVKERKLNGPQIPDCDSSAIRKWKIVPFEIPNTALVAKPLIPTNQTNSAPVQSQPTQQNGAHETDVQGGDDDSKGSKYRSTKFRSSATITSSALAPTPVLTSTSTSTPTPTSTSTSASTVPFKPTKPPQTEAVKALLEKIDTLASSQKVLFQNSSTYSTKLESLEYMNKSVFLKIDQMMENMQETFKGMQSQIRALEDMNQRLEKKLEEVEVQNLNLRKNLALAKGTQHGRATSEGSIDSIQDPTLSDDASISSETRASMDDEKRSITGKKAHFQDLKQDSDEISLPANIPAKRKRWFEMEVAAGIDTSQLEKTEFNRQETVYELIDSEDDYVNDLQILIHIHISRIKASGIVPEKDIPTLFSNVEQLLAVNKDFAEQLKARRKSSPIVGKICDIVGKMTEYFKIYSVYCSNHGTAGALLKKLLTTNAEFKTLHMHIMQVPEVKQLTLESYLIKPVQRICKYPLLLREILKNTPEGHPDREDTVEALEKIEAVITMVNNRTQLLDHSQKLLFFQTNIESDEPLELLQPSRKFLLEGTLEVSRRGEKKKDRYFVLCNDLLLVCKPSGFSKGRYQLTHRLKSDMYLVNINSSEGPLTFELILVGQEKWIVACANEEEKKKWIKNLEQANLETMARTTQVRTRLGIEETNSSQVQIKVPTPSDDDEKPNRTSKAMKLLGFEDSDTSRSNARRSVSYLQDKRGFDTNSLKSKDSSSVAGGLPHPDTLENVIEEIFITTKDYFSRTEYELSFDRDVHVVVTNKRSEEFWKVERKGTVGYLPASYLSKVEGTQEELQQLLEECYSTKSPGLRQGSGVEKKVGREGFLAAGRTWRQVSLADGTTYFYSPETYETCYQLPRDHSEHFFSWFEEPMNNYPDWKLIENNSLRYYLNTTTQETVWTIPGMVSENPATVAVTDFDVDD